MSDAVYPVAGSKLFIGDAVTPKGIVSLSDFAAVSWTEVDGWVNAGELGDTQEVGTQEMINRRRTVKFKTTRNAEGMENQFVPLGTDPGQIKMKAAADDDCDHYPIKVEWGADCTPTGTATVSKADPAVVTWTGHGQKEGQPVVFTEVDGATLPASVVAGQVYYVVGPVTDDTFGIATTAGGTPIDTDSDSASTGTITVTAPPVGMTDYFLAMVLPGKRSGGGASDPHLRTWTVEPTSNIVEV